MPQGQPIVAKISRNPRDAVREYGVYQALWRDTSNAKLAHIVGPVQLLSAFRDTLNPHVVVASMALDGTVLILRCIATFDQTTAVQFTRSC